MTFGRRQILWGGALGLAGGALVGCEDKKPARPASAVPPNGAKTSSDDASLDALSAAAARIIPSEGEGPGAREAGVGDYLAAVLTDKDLSHVAPVLRRGGTFLNGAARKAGVARFSAATATQQDDILGALAQGKMRPNNFSGPAFVRVLVALTLEGFLGDPRHGGNKNRIAWSWLNHDPHGRGAAGGHHE